MRAIDQSDSLPLILIRKRIDKQSRKSHETPITKPTTGNEGKHDSELPERTLNLKRRNSTDKKFKERIALLMCGDIIG